MLKQGRILIADGGSTKVDWVLLDNNDVIYNTSGLNPFIVDAERIKSEINTILVPKLQVDIEQISQIYFYGAGCSSKENCTIVEEGIKKVFKNSEVFVDHDMLGAVKALCGDEAGIACILGTGSNCCVYDGSKITDELKCLGHLAGDEGSGNYIGKMVLQSFCYGTMPMDIRESFIEDYNVSPKTIVAQLYSAEKPNAFLAQFTKFVLKHSGSQYSRDIEYKAFKDFIEKNVLTLDAPSELSINFTGSVAYYFQETLKEVLEEFNIPLGKIIRKPIQGMIEYHSK